MMLTLRPPMQERLRARAKLLFAESMEALTAGQGRNGQALAYRALAAMALAGGNRRSARIYLRWAWVLEDNS